MSAAADALAGTLRDIVEGEVRFRDELTLFIPAAHLVETLARAKAQGFAFLTDLTAVDRHPLAPRFEVVYLLTSIAERARVRLKVRADGADPVVPSATAVYAAAHWLEREAFDMFGIRFAGHPDLKRILMPDEWEGHPLRKDFPLVEEPVQFAGHRPEVPSRIIPRTPPKQV